MGILQSKYINHIFFLVCCLALFGIYYSGHEAMLIDDGISGIWEIKMQGLKGYWRSFGFENFYYGHYAIVAMLYGLFGLKPIGWFLFFIGMHALNSTLLFMLGKKCFALVSANAEAVLMALCSAILFLISPYQSENIIWAATSHYCVSLFILLVSLYWLIQSMEGRKPFSNILLHALLAFSLLTLEISFLFPPLLLAFYFLFKILNKNKLSLKEYFIGVLLPQSVLVCIYCGFHKGNYIFKGRSYYNPN